MKIPPWILGACALVPVAGAVAGMSVNTTPLAAETASTIPEGSPIMVADAAPVTRERLPDHYAMETPDGRVEVHELAMRGRDHDCWLQARSSEARYEAGLAAAPPSPLPASAPAPLALDEPAQVRAQPQIALGGPSPKVATSRMISISAQSDLE